MTHLFTVQDVRAAFMERYLRDNNIADPEAEIRQNIRENFGEPFIQSEFEEELQEYLDAYPRGKVLLEEAELITWEVPEAERDFERTYVRFEILFGPLDSPTLEGYRYDGRQVWVELRALKRKV